MFKINLKNITILVFIMTLGMSNLFAQEDARIDSIQSALERKVLEIEGLNQPVEINVNEESVQELLKGIALTNNLNIIIDPKINYHIIYNFSEINVKDFLLFLCKKYKLELEFIGNLIYLKPFVEIQEKTKYIPKELNVTFDTQSNLLSLDLSNDSLFLVAKKVAELTGKNIIVKPNLSNKMISAYILNADFETALEKLGLANDIQLTKSDNDFYIFELPTNTAPDQRNNNNQKNRGRTQQANRYKKEASQEEGLEIKALNEDDISANCTGAAIVDIINEIGKQLKRDFVFLSEPTEEKNLYISNQDLESILTAILIGSKHTFNIKDNVYIIGEKSEKEIQAIHILPIQFRSIEKTLELIPSALKTDVEIKEYTELNSLIIQASYPKFKKIEQFIRQIDKPIPVILIEVMIIDINKNFTIATGVEAGLGEPPAKSTGQVFPAIDVSLSTKGINDIISSFNGFGWFKIGKVTPNFYMNIKALEDNGYISVHSTPKLSTLNGHEAQLQSGETKYYYEDETSLISTQNIHETNRRTWKPVNADLTIKIKPFVSANEQITLEVEVQQSDFTPREYEDAPPGSVTRNFKSQVRIKDQEMILLGGLDRKSSSTTNKGLPLISRIPILNWFTSSKSKSNSKSKLSIFIKPTIIN